MSPGVLQADVAIMGGGLAGLTCAVALRDSGLNTVLFEAAETLGGRARSWTDSTTGDVIDIGPHIFLTEYRNVLALLDLLGTRDRLVWETARLIRLTEGAQVTDMQMHPLPPPLHLAPSFARVRSLDWRDKFSNLGTMLLGMRFDEELVLRLDEMSAAEMLKRRCVTQRFIDWFWATACIAVMNVPLERCSAGALMRVFAQMIGRRQYHIGFAADGLAELYVPGAARAIADAGGRIYTRTSVSCILPDGKRAAGLVLHDGARVQARWYVAAVPPQALACVLPHEWLHLPSFKHLAAFEASPYVSSYLWFDRKLTNDKFWTRVWNPHGLNSDFYDLSNIRPDWRNRGSVVAANTIYSHRAHDLSDVDIVACTLREIRDVLPLVASARLQHAVVNRIPMAIPCPLPGTERKRAGTISPVDGLLLAGDWTRTELPASMESAVYSGWAAAEVIWRSIGRPRTLVHPKLPRQVFARLVYGATRGRRSARD